MHGQQQAQHEQGASESAPSITRHVLQSHLHEPASEFPRVLGFRVFFQPAITGCSAVFGLNKSEKKKTCQTYTHPVIGTQVVDLLLEHSLPEVLAHKLDDLEGLTHPWLVLAVPVQGQWDMLCMLASHAFPTS